MKHLYLAIYSIIAPPEVSPKFFTTEEIYAENDHGAIAKAENIEIALDTIENNRPGTAKNLLTAKAIILNNIRDQENKRTIYTVGYTTNE